MLKALDRASAFHALGVRMGWNIAIHTCWTLTDSTPKCFYILKEELIWTQITEPNNEASQLWGETRICGICHGAVYLIRKICINEYFVSHYW